MCIYGGGIYALTILMSNSFDFFFFYYEVMDGEVLFCFVFYPFWSQACCSSA